MFWGPCICVDTDLVEVCLHWSKAWHLLACLQVITWIRKPSSKKLTMHQHVLILSSSVSIRNLCIVWCLFAFSIGEALLHTMLDLQINRPQAKICAFGMKQQTVKHSPQTRFVNT